MGRFASDLRPYDTTQDVTAEYDSAWDSELQYGCNATTVSVAPTAPSSSAPPRMILLEDRATATAATAPAAVSATTALVSARASRATWEHLARPRRRASKCRLLLNARHRAQK